VASHSAWRSSYHGEVSFISSVCVDGTALCCRDQDTRTSPSCPELILYRSSGHVARNADVGVMAHLWRIPVRSWTFVFVRRIADLPFPFADIRRIGLDDFPKLISNYRVSMSLTNSSRGNPRLREKSINSRAIETTTLRSGADPTTVTPRPLRNSSRPSSRRIRIARKTVFEFTSRT
jgi:hypothetical protein